METDPGNWTSWGATRPSLDATAEKFLERSLGRLEPATSADVGDVTPAPSALPGAARAALIAAAGDDGVREGAEARARHAGGQSYIDLIRRRAGDVDAPDAVVLPADAAGVARVLDVCSEHAVAVVPFGGGTSVVGGVEPIRGRFASVVALDLSRLDRVLAIEPDDLTAVFEPGVRTPAAERALAAHRLTLGHFPQSFERASIGGYVVTRSAGQASSGYGRVDDLVLGLRVATPAGELVLPAQPASAAGPDLRRLVLGSEGVLGVVTEATLRVHRAPEVTSYEGWLVPSWAAGLDVMRGFAQDGPRPDIARLSDPAETSVGLTLTGPRGLQRRGLDAYLRLRRTHGGCLVILGFEGRSDDVAHRRGVTRRMVREAGGVALGQRAGKSWAHGRFSGPYLRDTLLDSGVLVETLETAAPWSRLPAVHAAVNTALGTALQATPPLVGCHVSHIYPTGASLYFTVLARAVRGGEVGQWQAAKQAANDALVTAGATITHHHAVGTAHRDHLAAEYGDLGLDVLRAVKARLDPVGILNPGKLLPPLPSALTG